MTKKKPSKWKQFWYSLFDAIGIENEGWKRIMWTLCSLITIPLIVLWSMAVYFIIGKKLIKLPFYKLFDFVFEPHLVFGTNFVFSTLYILAGLLVFLGLIVWKNWIKEGFKKSKEEFEKEPIKNHSSKDLHRKFVSLGDMNGQRKAEIIARCGVFSSSKEFNGGTVCTWSRKDYSIKLVFDNENKCSRVSEEVLGWNI